MYEKTHKIKRPRIYPQPQQSQLFLQQHQQHQHQQHQQPPPKIWLPMPPSVLKRLSFFIETRKIPHILFHGNPGTGKRTIVNQFIKEIYHNIQKMIETNVMYVNCAHEKGIQFIRDEIKTFARINVQQQPFGGGNKSEADSNTHNTFKIIILQNADKLTIDAQSALRRSIEIYSHNTRFFIIVENVQKIMNPILSRFCEIYIPDRMDTDGNVVSLHTLQHPSTPLYNAFTHLDKWPTFPSDQMTPKQWVDICAAFYEQGASTYDLVSYGATRLPPALQAKWEIEFHKVKSEFRCEKLLMFYLIMFLTENASPPPTDSKPHQTT